MKRRLTPPEARESRRSQAVALSAQGMTRSQIAATLNVSAESIKKDLEKPKSREDLKRLRDEFRSYVMERTQQGLIQGTMGVVQQAIGEGDAKSLELATRAAVNLDKLTASASGETQKVEVTGLPPVTNVDLKVLITDLLGRNDPHKRLGA